MTGTMCGEAHPVEGTLCVHPAGPAHGDVHEDLDGRRWADDEVEVDADDVIVDEPDVPAEVWVIRGALGLLGAAALLLVSAVGFAAAAIWTSGLLSDRLGSSALLCVAAGVAAAVAGWAGVRQALLPRPDDVEPDDVGSLPTPPPRVVERPADPRYPGGAW